MNIKERYQKEIVSKLQKELEIKNVNAVPRIKSITISVGIPASKKDARFLEAVEKTLTRITGQKPLQTKAKKSIAGFKIREGMVVGTKVTLRGGRMWDFLDRLLTFAFPRITDFRGISEKNVDRNGNLSVGFKEYLPFPEIKPDEVDQVHGLEISIATNAGTREAGLALFKQLGFPFQS